MKKYSSVFSRYPKKRSSAHPVDHQCRVMDVSVQTPRGSVCWYAAYMKGSPKFTVGGVVFSLHSALRLRHINRDGSRENIRESDDGTVKINGIEASTSGTSIEQK